MVLGPSRLGSSAAIVADRGGMGTEERFEPVLFVSGCYLSATYSTFATWPDPAKLLILLVDRARIELATS